MQKKVCAARRLCENPASAFHLATFRAERRVWQELEVSGECKIKIRDGHRRSRAEFARVNKQQRMKSSNCQRNVTGSARL